MTQRFEHQPFYIKYDSEILTREVISSQVIRQTKYVKNNVEARSCNHCCSDQAIIIAYA